MSPGEQRLVHAAYTSETITVYQAYSPAIAEAAVRAGTFVTPFSRQRMTWIKRAAAPPRRRARRGSTA